MGAEYRETGGEVGVTVLLDTNTIRHVTDV